MSNDRSTVLLVDDESAILETLALQLRRDHEVLTAESGDDALRLLAATGPVAAASLPATVRPRRSRCRR